MARYAGLLATVGFVASIGCADAADVQTESGSPGAVVNVKLMNMNHSVDLTKNLGIGMKGDMATAPMKIEADKYAVPAGLVTFKVTNASGNMEHEMLVVPIDDMQTPLPYNAAENRVDEEAAHSAGEVPEMEPGKSGELTVELRPGLYALLCNIPGHYSAGMWRVLAVQ
jgi:uncharacterized cupredoxin-like copper-binding protein